MPIRSHCCLANIVVLLCVCAVQGQAQTCLPVHGRWTLNAAQSQLAAGLSFNPFYRVKDIELTTSDAGGGKLAQSWHFDGPHIHDIVAYSFTVDGRSQATGAHSLLDSVPIDVVPIWQNCTLIVDARSTLFGTDVRTRNVYVVDAGGRRLSILQTGRSGIGHIERTLVFDKTGEAP